MCTSVRFVPGLWQTPSMKIALIAHDRMKSAIVELVREYEQVLHPC